MDNNYIHASQENGKAFIQRQIQGEVIMLNLLKFNKTANYQKFPELAPDSEISGREAYNLYMKAVLPLLDKAGGKLEFIGNGGYFLIGPEAENWDLVLLVTHASVDKFLAFANDGDYNKIAGHRTAAIADSRLLPIQRK